MTADGALHEADVLVFGTGFGSVDAAAELNVAGREWRQAQGRVGIGSVEAFRGITVPGFPNFFMLLGPNTGLGHTSVVFMMESPRFHHVLSCLRVLSRAGKASTIEARAPAGAAQVQRRFAAQAAPRGVERGGCRSWYLDDAGVNRALSRPGFSFEYWARTRRARRADYAVTR